MKRLIAFLTLRFLIVVAPLAIAGCGGKREAKPEKPSTMPAAQVRVQTVQSKSRPLTEEAVGTVRAKLHATLAAQVSGRIEEMPVRLGDRLQKGQLIARLNAAEIGARLAQAEASLEQAERDWKRISTLFEQQGVTRAEFDAAQSRQQVAKAAVAEARAMMNYLEVLAPFDAVV
ncbi:MAG: efflux RND transporter periplasmic adaptor subunit, partial [Verrucomicrobiota bacterium]